MTKGCRQTNSDRFPGMRNAPWLTFGASHLLCSRKCHALPRGAYLFWASHTVSLPSCFPDGTVRRWTRVAQVLAMHEVSPAGPRAGMCTSYILREAFNLIGCNAHYTQFFSFVQ